MKQLPAIITLLILSLVILPAQAQLSSGTNNGANPSVKGAYSLTRQVANDGTKDSLMNRQQLKIYTDRHMIYAYPITGDSLAGYGIGTYRTHNGKVIEDIFYTSSEGAVKRSFEVSINKTGNGFNMSVVIPEYRGRRWNLSEDYTNVGKNVSTPLDGVWKQTKVTFVAPDGTTNTNSNPTQFKVFESGNFIWVNTRQDLASQKLVSQYGYGTFDMQGNDKVTEVNNSSTFRTALVGKPITLQVAFTGKDAFRQTMVLENGARMIEEYQRLQ